MTREFILDLDVLNEEISLGIIDEILVKESSIDDDIFKFDELVPYIRGVDIIYGIVIKSSGIKRSEDVDIPLIEIIKIVIDARQNKKIDSKEAWAQIKDLMKRAGEFTKYYNKELKIDLDILMENITLKVIDAFKFTENFKIEDISKFMMFDSFIDGAETTYSSVLESLGLEEKEEFKIPLLEIIYSIRDAYVENRINTEEDAWRQIKDVMNKIINN